MDTTPTSLRATPRQLAWLQDQLQVWHAEGLLDRHQTEAISGRYVAVRRLGLGRLLLALGGTFLAVGVLWTVAANLDELSPLLRFLAVLALWLTVVAAAHVLGSRRVRRGLREDSPVVGTLRGVAALGYGAVVFQAAQSLQVPAYEPVLVGCWGLGALAYAYAVRAVAPLAVGVVATASWLVWHLTMLNGNGLGLVVALLVCATAASGVAALHSRLGPRSFAASWRVAGAVMLLAGLFAAAVPATTGDGLAVDRVLVAVVVLALALVVVGGWLGHGAARLQPLAGALATVVGASLVLWETAGSSTGGQVLTAGDVVQAVISIGVYVAAAAWIASVGVTSDQPALTWLALSALVVFTTFQSFAVFAQIITGAALFVALGAVFAASGFVFDRARRELESTLEGASA